MTTADGTVHGVTWIVYNGPVALRWNLVLLSEGYRQEELPLYHQHAREFVTALRATRPFDRVWHAVNVFRVDVSSVDSGTDDPATCGDGTVGAGTEAHTYFDSTLCGHRQTTRRLLTVNSDTATDVADAQVPGWTCIVVLVNTRHAAGSGGIPCVYAAAQTPTSMATDTGIHELGHTAFNLADEYGGCVVGQPNRYTGPEPLEVNVTTVTDRARLKWGGLVEATTNLPTTDVAAADCSTCVLPPNPVPVGTVGAFVNAFYSHCGIYRPEFNCMMRSFGQPFCMVCRGRIRTVLSRYTEPEAMTSLDQVAVRVPTVHRVFDPDLEIVKQTIGGHLPLEGTTPGGIVQSQVWPQAPPGVPAAGLFGYLYRVDLMTVTITGVPVAVTRMEVNVGQIVRQSYAGGPSGPVQIFVIVEGGPGSIMPDARMTLNGRLVLRFHNTVKPGQGSFFAGFASVHPPRAATIRVFDNHGRSYDIGGMLAPAFP